MFDCCFFDLDGTLTDPYEGITSAVQYALKKYGIDEPDRRKLACFIGPPLHDSFVKYYGFSNLMAFDAITKYREYFKDIGIFENELYDGIPQLLEKLKHCGKRIIMATSKPECFAVRIADHFGISDYFDAIVGSELDGTRILKADVIKCALERLSISDVSHSVMIGDRRHDIAGGKACGMTTVGVLYGYGSRDELEGEGADVIVESVAELEGLLLAE